MYKCSGVEYTIDTIKKFGCCCKKHLQNMSIMKNLRPMNLIELDNEELSETSGGWVGVAVGVAVAVALYVASEWDDISAGWNDAANGGEYNYQSCK